MIEKREHLLASIEKYISNGGAVPFWIVADVQLELEVDGQGKKGGWTFMTVGKHHFRFSQPNSIFGGEYYIIKDTAK